MDPAIETPHSEQVPPALHASWKHFKKVWSASSVSEAWNSLKRAFETLPTWAVFVGIVALLALIANPAIVLLLLTVGVVLAAIFLTVKHAVRSALREHDRELRR